MSTRSTQVKLFTEQSMNIELPKVPRKMTREEILFIVKMNVEELQELLCTIKNPNENVKELLINIVNMSNMPTISMDNKSDIEIMAEQVDAFVDIDYYNCNASAKVGYNVDDIFDVVHQANMNKKFQDGTFHKNSEGKIIKPPNWKEPNVVNVVKLWHDNGTW